MRGSNEVPKQKESRSNPWPALKVCKKPGAESISGCEYLLYSEAKRAKRRWPFSAFFPSWRVEFVVRPEASTPGERSPRTPGAPWFPRPAGGTGPKGRGGFDTFGCLGCVFRVLPLRFRSAIGALESVESPEIRAHSQWSS